MFDNDPEDLRQAKRESLDIFEAALAHHHLKDASEAKELLAQSMAVAKDDAVTRIYMERCQEFFENGHHVGTDELTREVKWDPAYELNIPEVDRQHKELLSCISRLSGLVRQNDRDGLKELLDFLASYTQTHFRTEEALMHEFKYPFLKEHVQEHRWFIKHYEKLRKDIEERRHDNKYLFFDINVFLVDWLINHIANTDNHMGKHIIRRGFKPDGQLAPQ